MNYSPKGDMLATGGQDTTVHTFNSRYNPTHTIDVEFSGAVTSVYFAQNDKDVST